MKLRSIDIKKFYRFNDFKLDLTYPKGHLKEGQPLDKICFIGQSGTGKTSLLNLVKHSMKNNSNLSEIEMECEGIFEYDFDSLKRYCKFFITDPLDSYFQEIYFKKEDATLLQIKKEIVNEHYKESVALINFPAELINDINDILNEDEEESGLIDELKFIIANEKSKLTKDIVNRKFFDFEKRRIYDLWKVILDEINSHHTTQLQLAQESATTFTKNNDDGKLIEYKIWLATNLSPILPLAEKLNLLLNKFKLEVETEFNFKSIDDLKFIKLKSIDGETIPYSGWSTGTKQVILTAIPIFKLNTDKAIILIDEPERSLYPDLQYEIINYYRQLSPNSQLIVATHSPIIASAFEPWEIVELKFNREGNIFRELYYENENHVDNYTLDPRFLSWSSILMKIFDLGEDGNENFRSLALTQAAGLKAKLEEMNKANGSKDENFKKVFADYQKLAQKVGWV